MSELARFRASVLRSVLGALLVLAFVHAAPAAEVLDLSRPIAERAPSDGSGPRLEPLPTPPVTAAPPLERAPGPRVETHLDLPASLFLPGKSDPQDWMATGTWARITYDGFNYDYGYDPLAQTYDVMVSGYAVQGGILVQETVGVMAVPTPIELQAGQIERVECWFFVTEHNLYPNEWVGITALEDEYEPSSSLNSLEARLLYEDARGFRGAAYAIDHFGVGAHAIDLGTVAVDHFEESMAGKGWFGVGFGADGWDLSGSLDQMVYWKMAGGGRLPENVRPLFRVVYNAAPTAFSLLTPANGATVPIAQPTLGWNAASDPNGDAPITYRVHLGTHPDLAGAVEFSVVDQTSTVPPLRLSSGTYYWRVDAIDPQGAVRQGTLQSFTVAIPTDAAPAAARASISCAPNPFNPRTEILLEVPRGAVGQVLILDARGRRVRSLYQGPLQAPAATLVWDGKDDAGADCASGVYEIRALLSGESVHVRVALVR